MRAAARRLRKRLGRRGAVLALLGTGKVCYGAGYLLTPQPEVRGLELLTTHGDIRCWAMVWVVCGAITASSGLMRIGRDRWGFIAALVPPFVWGGAFLWASVMGDFPRGLAIFGWYGCSHIGLILWAASVPEYAVPHYTPREKP
ncbi:hypothetical protein JK361_22505 [Streptomyces sp. 5-8]|uniref:Integral membrane protein n=1 Tax=Streptomyces musisoli TaxID=2802280 RepID=A0ABS1P4Q3_9ACTN|nr:hypothetical protein [Streptomyces musisoli]